VILNGFHETWPIVYPEDAYGLARTGQTIANVTDGSLIRLFVDDEPFSLATARSSASSASSTCRSACSAARSSSRPRAGGACSSAPGAWPRSSTATWRPWTTGHGAGRERAHRALLRARHPRPRGDLRRPAPRQGLRREGARAAGGARTRPPRRPAAAHPQQRARARLRHGPRPGRRRPDDRRGQRRRRRREGRRPRRAAARGAAAALQVPRLSLGRRGARRRPRRPRRAHARPGRGRRLRHDRVRPPLARRGLLATQRHRARGRARPPAGGALQPLPAHAGDGPRRGSRRAGQGRDRPRLRGPLLLGHGDLRRPLPDPHEPAVGQADAGLPLRDAGGRPPARGRDRPSRRPLPVADDPAARRPRRGTRRGPPSTTSTPTSPTPCASTAP
jgi:hypothetical protein